jgi:hypothetical protein
VNRYRLFSTFLVGALSICVPVNVYANSSWHWITTSPMKVLPYVIILTLIIEIAFVFTMGKIQSFKRVFYVISLANLFSYLAPYIERAYRFIPTSGSFSISAAFNKGPYYIVLTGYLLLTIIVELPITFILLRKYAKSKTMLAISILSANIVTTIAVAIIERTLCVGQW